MWKKIPEQVKRLFVIIVVLVVLLFIARSILVPADFGKFGHYRASAVDDIVAQNVQFAGREVCGECHSEITETIKSGYHKNVACEVCHGPAMAHVANADSVKPVILGERKFCVLCHEYLPSRPTGFPQIVSEAHNPMKLCKSCHNPHSPQPPETPKDCSACHSTIARTKSISHHIYVSCERCHETPEQHRINPRLFRSGKPTTREFCGGCHDKNAKTREIIKTIDITTHGERYVCWQCHYPHMPEGR